MGYFHCIANRLDVTGYLGGLWAEDGGDADPQQTAHCEHVPRVVRVRIVLLCLYERVWVCVGVGGI